MSRINDEQHASAAEHLVNVIRESQDFARAAYGADFDLARRNIPPNTSGLEIDQLKDPYLLQFLGLEPLPGDPTIDHLERRLDDDYPLEPEEIERELGEASNGAR